MKLLQESPVAFLAPLKATPEQLYVTELPTPKWPVSLAGTDRGLMFTRANTPLDRMCRWLSEEWGIEPVFDRAPLEDAAHRYEAYFAGDTAPMELTVQTFRQTTFIIRVHRLLTRIPYGVVMSYGEVAACLGNPGAARAVGNACGRNNILIGIPCHRVVAANGVGGFGVNIDIKEFLLEHEQVDWRSL